MNRRRFRAGACALVVASLGLVAFLAGRPVVAQQGAEGGQGGQQQAERVKVLYLGDKGHHKPAERFAQLEPALKARGIDLTYTDKVTDLNPETLKPYAGLMIFANTTQISPEQEKALLDYVRAGNGFIPVHCASYCFLNSPRYVALVGGQFRTHKTGTFTTKIVDPSHAIMKGYKGFETWDETYVHTKLNKDIHVLQTRLEGDREEPWTWVRNEGKGRVFYTAYGHDHRTFGNPGFHDLIERGVRWATRTDAASLFERPRMVGPSPDAKPFEYITADGIPFYDPKNPGRGGGKWNQMPKPLPPAESMKHLQLPEGFEARLFVSEPDVVKPITMNWDDRGRLWVVESIDYPNRVTDAGKGVDRIKICEDTDNDGKADKFTVFAEGLNIPTTLTFANGGVVVMERQSTWFLKDTDNDGKADVKKELFRGWYRQTDTHAGPSNLQYGLDNTIWGMLGYAGFAGEVGGKTLRFQQGFYRFKPDGSELEFLRSTNNNTWGIGFSEEGIVFGSTANGNPSVYLPIPNRYYEQVKGGFAPEVLKPIADNYFFNSPAPKVRQVDWHGGYTAAAGHALYTARAYPKEYWNRTAFVTEPTGHIVGVFVLEPRGSDFKSRNAFNLLASFDEWSAPIMAEVGPDGFVWVIDWYNYIVQHNPTPVGYKNGPGNAYETPRRDKEHGRIYRVVYTGAKTAPKLDLSAASPAQLVDALKNDNQFWRKHAQRLLVEKQDKGVIPALVGLVNDPSVDEIGLNVGAVHALWTLKGLGALDGGDPTATAAAVAAMKHPSAGVRRNAVAVLPATEASLAAVVGAKLLDDADAQVRLATLLAIATMPAGGDAGAKAGAALYGMLDKPENVRDRWIPDAAVAAAARHDAAFLNHALLASAKANAGKAPPAAPAPAPERPKPPVKETQNLIQNPSMEDVDGDRPANWRPSTFGGSAKFALSAGRTGERGVHIVSTDGADAGWSQDVRVKPNTRYRLSAWVKTKGVTGDGRGVQFNLHQLQQQGLPKALRGDNDWTELTSEFASGGNNRLQLNLLFGGWGPAKGEAWFDDVKLIEIGPGGPLSLASLEDDDGSGKAGEIVKLVTRHYAARGPGESVVATLAAAKGADKELVTNVLDGLVAGWPEGAATAPNLSDAQKAQFGEIAGALSPDQRDRLLVLAGRWGRQDLFAGQMTEVIKTVKATLAGQDADAAERVDAAKRLIRLVDDAASVDEVLKQVTPQTGAELARGLVGAISESKITDAGDKLIAKWGDLSPAARKAAVSVMMRRTPWTVSMLRGIEAKKLLRGDLAPSDWQTLQIHKERQIASLAKKLDANQMDPNRAKVLEAMLPALANPGDSKAGHALYTARCAQCHIFNGQGGKVGPELSGIGARDPKETLADIVDPNRSVEANYRLWTIDTKEGDSYSGRLDVETQTTVEVLDAVGERHVIQRKEIATMNASNLSIMPAGLIDDLKPADVAALMEYLKTSHHEEKK
jgi:putative membrane-bound dehydrogenase-like protein